MDNRKIGAFFESLSRVTGRRKHRKPRFFSPTRRRKRHLRAACVCGATAVGLTVILLLLGLFGVREILVEGDSVYSDDMIAKAAGISCGDAVTGIDTRRAGRRLLEALPYLTDAQISVSLSRTVTVRVTGTKQLYYTVQDGMCYLITEELAVRERSVEETDFTHLGAARVELPTFFAARVGETLCFRLPEETAAETAAETSAETSAETAGEADTVQTEPDAAYKRESAEKYAYIPTLLQTLSASDLAGSLTAMNLTNRFALTVTLENRCTVLLGGANRMEEKLPSVYACWQKKRDSVRLYGRMDVSNPSMCIFRETDALTDGQADESEEQGTEAPQTTPNDAD